MALTVRMSAETERALNRLAKRTKLSRSDVVREAIARYENSDSHASAAGPYQDWVDVIGVVDIGARDAGRTTGEQFAETLRKDGHRRAR
jgi:hypothetical protein